MAYAVKIAAIISLIVSFSGIVYMADNWMGLMKNVLPEKKKWLFINPYLIFRKDYLTDEGEICKKRVARGFIIFLIGMLLFLAMYGFHNSIEKL